MRQRTAFLLWTCLASVLLGACDDSAHHACEVIVQRHVPRVRELVHDDLERAMTGVTASADLVAPGFGVEDPAQRERQLRWAIQHRIREPPRGIPEMMMSPMTFVAAVDLEGHVVCRDIEPDPMRGLDVGALFPHVRAALTEGVASYRLVEFQPTAPPPPVDGVDAGPPPSASVTIVYAAPARVDGRIVGAVIAGTPLWSTARRLTRQIQGESENSAGAILWVYLYRGDELFHAGTPSTLDEIVPDGAARTAGFARSEGGFCGEENQFGRWYCYGVVHLPELGDDVGAVIYRSDPVQ